MAGDDCGLLIADGPGPSHHLGLALGGRWAAGFARRLMVPVSNDTFLRVVRRRRSPVHPRPCVVGIDDWAWKGNHRYGTIICDLERRRPATLLPDALSLQRTPSARTIARRMTVGRDTLSKSETITIAAIEEGFRSSCRPTKLSQPSMP